MTFLPNGNVGIGTTNPTAKLHVFNGNNSYGAILANASEPEFSLYTKTLTTLKNNESFRLGLKYKDEERNGFISFFRGGNETGGFLGFSTNGLERMKIDTNGNVGIGITDPKNKLSVNGTIWAKEVKVSLTDAADWVFDTNYKLRPLAEVEKFINENKHLPEVPSAEEFRQNDMNVSQMSNKLLQKIEELTLYAIEQNKKLEEQQKNIAEQQNVVKEQQNIVKEQNKVIEELKVQVATLMDKKQ
jgi:hypothetical protein